MPQPRQLSCTPLRLHRHMHTCAQVCSACCPCAQERAPPHDPAQATPSMPRSFCLPIFRSLPHSPHWATTALPDASSAMSRLPTSNSPLSLVPPFSYPEAPPSMSQGPSVSYRMVMTPSLTTCTTAMQAHPQNHCWLPENPPLPGFTPTGSHIPFL